MKKRRSLLITALFLLILGLVTIMSKPTVNPAQAKTYLSRAQAKKEIRQLTAQLKKAEKATASAKKQYNKYKKQSKKNSRGAFPLIAATIRNESPLIVQSGSYYYVKNPSHPPSILGVYTGEVRRVGGTKIINGMTCVVVKEVRDSAYGKAKKAAKKYEACQARCINIKSKRKKLKKGLTFKLRGGSRTAYIGIRKYLLSGGTYYNKIKWKSSNSSVASVSKKGVVSGKKEGKVTITAKMSLSKKTSRFKVTVKKKSVVKKSSVLKMSHSVLSIPKESYRRVRIEGESKADLWTSSNTSVVEVDKKGFVYAKGEGVATVTARIGKSTGHVKVNVYTPKVHFLENKVEYTENDIGKQKTYKFMSNIAGIAGGIRIFSEGADIYVDMDSIDIVEPDVGPINKYAEGSITVTFKKGKEDYDDFPLAEIQAFEDWGYGWDDWDPNRYAYDPDYQEEQDYTNVFIESDTMKFFYKSKPDSEKIDNGMNSQIFKRLSRPYSNMELKKLRAM